MPTLEESIAVYRQAIGLRTQRHEILASNIANADTPNFKARDIDFRSAIAAAIDQRGLKLQTSQQGHFAIPLPGGNGPKLLFRNEYQSAVDGNTVEMDHERSQISDNAIQYQILTQLLNDEFQGMRQALTSQQG